EGALVYTKVAHNKPGRVSPRIPSPPPGSQSRREIRSKKAVGLRLTGCSMAQPPRQTQATTNRMENQFGGAMDPQPVKSDSVGLAAYLMARLNIKLSALIPGSEHVALGPCGVYPSFFLVAPLPRK